MWGSRVVSLRHRQMTAPSYLARRWSETMGKETSSVKNTS